MHQSPILRILRLNCCARYPYVQLIAHTYTWVYMSNIPWIYCIYCRIHNREYTMSGVLTHCLHHHCCTIEHTIYGALQCARSTHSADIATQLLCPVPLCTTHGTQIYLSVYVHHFMFVMYTLPNTPSWIHYDWCSNTLFTPPLLYTIRHHFGSPS